MFVRIGYYLIIVSLIIWFIFATSYQSDEPLYNLFLIGLGLLILGVFIIVRNRRPSEKAERFRTIRRIRSRKKEE